MTVREIAKAVGVAPSTVSLVLNSKPGVRKDKRERIAALLRENGYEIRDNTAGVNSVKGEIKFIRYLAVNHSRERNEDFFVGLLNGAEIGARNLGYSLSLVSTTPSMLSSTLTSLEHQEDVVGAVLLASEMTGDQLPHIQFFTKPIVTLDMPLELDRWQINGINTDNYGGIDMAVKYLYDLGHRSIGFLKGETGIGGLDSRYQSFKSSMEDLGLTVNPEHVLNIDARYEVAIRQMTALLKSIKSLPTAFLAANDIIAAGCVRALCQVGYDVPKDVSVIGFDNGNMSTFISPPLTTVGINRQRMGELAVERVVELSKHPDDVVLKSVVSVSLIKRGSVSSPRR